MLNKVQIIGRIGADPEMRYTPENKAVIGLRVAVSEKYKDNEHTEWFSVVAWEKLAENCNKHCFKGQLVYIEGKLKTRSWEQEGIKRYKSEVIANKIDFLSWLDNPQSNSNEWDDTEEIPL